MPRATTQRIRILLVEDLEGDSQLIQRQLVQGGLKFDIMRVDTAATFEKALLEEEWDIILSDYSLPGFGGMEALALLMTLKKEIPFILVSGSLGASVAVESVRLGARDYIFKDQLHRLVPTIIREVQEAEDRLRRDLAEAEVHQSREKLDRLKRFFPATVAERIVSGSQGDPFEWHRKDVTVLFIDLRGFTSFVELSEPEVVVQVLKEYYSGVARAVLNCGGTIGHVAGDGIMAFFNDPMEIPNPQEMAVRAGIQIREELGHLRRKWADMEYSIDFGAGIASGFATVGSIGVEGCWDYSVIGTVTNVAFRLCSAADKGQILIPQRLIQTVSHFAETAPIGTHELKGIHHPLVVFNVIGLKSQPK